MIGNWVNTRQEAGGLFIADFIGSNVLSCD